MSTATPLRVQIFLLGVALGSARAAQDLGADHEHAVQIGARTAREWADRPGVVGHVDQILAATIEPELRR